MTTYQSKRTTVTAEQFTEARGADLFQLAQSGSPQGTYHASEQGGFFVDIGASPVRLSFGDYVLLDGDGNPREVVRGADFEAAYEEVLTAVQVPSEPDDIASPRSRRSRAPSVVPDPPVTGGSMPPVSPATGDSTPS